MITRSSPRCRGARGAAEVEEDELLAADDDGAAADVGEAADDGDDDMYGDLGGGDDDMYGDLGGDDDAGATRRRRRLSIKTPRSCPSSRPSASSRRTRRSRPRRAELAGAPRTARACSGPDVGRVTSSYPAREDMHDEGGLGGGDVSGGPSRGGGSASPAERPSRNLLARDPGASVAERAHRRRRTPLHREEQQIQAAPRAAAETLPWRHTMLLEHLDGYEAAQCIAAGGAVLALSAGGCTAYGVALAFVVFLWLAELALPHHAVKARILSPRGTPRPSSQLRKVLADAEVPEIEEQLAELGAKAPGDVQYLDDADIADLQLSPEQGSRLKSVAAQAAAQP